MQPDTPLVGRGGPSLAGVVLRTAREALEVDQREMAVAAGCGEDLVCRIECGDLDPALDTVERILNGSGLEFRAGPAAPNRSYRGPLVDRDETARLRAVVADAQALRQRVGAPPPGPPVGALPDWDGEDPAPPRPFGAAEGRRDGGGWAALVVRSAVAEGRSDRRVFARACGLDEDDLAAIAAGETRPSTGELAALLARAGSGLRVRIEVYDDHDDGLHLSSRTDPVLHRPRRRAAPSPPGSTAATRNWPSARTRSCWSSTARRPRCAAPTWPTSCAPSRQPTGPKTAMS